MLKEVSSEKQSFLKNFEEYCNQLRRNDLEKLQESVKDCRRQQNALKYVVTLLLIMLVLCVCLLSDSAVVFVLTCAAVLVAIYMSSKIYKDCMDKNHLFLDFIFSYFKNFENLKEQGGFVVYRALSQSELFGKKFAFDSEDCFIAQVDHKRVLITEASVNLRGYLILVMEMENKYYRPTMAPREGKIFKFIYKNKMIDVSFGESNIYEPINKVAYTDIAQNKKLFYKPFWDNFEKLKDSVFGLYANMAFFEDKLVFVLREKTNLFEPVKFNMKVPTIDQLGEVAWQIQTIISFSDLYDEQREVLLDFAKENDLDYKEITSNRFV